MAVGQFLRRRLLLHQQRHSSSAIFKRALSRHAGSQGDDGNFAATRVPYIGAYSPASSFFEQDFARLSCELFSSSGMAGHFYSTWAQPKSPPFREASEVPVTENFLAALEGSLQPDFDPSLYDGEGWPPPPAVYLNPAVAEAEMQKVFWHSWQVVGSKVQVESPGDYFTGDIGALRFVVCRDGAGKLQAFHNVCRHHAAAVANGEGRCDRFVCPYHGWTYSLDGRLQRATRLSGIKNFSPRDYGLVAIPRVGLCGPLVLMHVEAVLGGAKSPAPQGEAAKQSAVASEEEICKEWMDDYKGLPPFGNLPHVKHLAMKQWEVNCNWKVLVDSFLGLSYSNTSASQVASINSIQNAPQMRVVEASGAAIAGDKETFNFSGAAHAFNFPNFFASRCALLPNGTDAHRPSLGRDKTAFCPLL